MTYKFLYKYLNRMFFHEIKCFKTKSCHEPHLTSYTTTQGFLAIKAFQTELANRSSISQAFLSHVMPTVRDGLIRVMSRNIRVLSTVHSDSFLDIIYLLNKLLRSTKLLSATVFRPFCIKVRYVSEEGHQ